MSRRRNAMRKNAVKVLISALLALCLALSLVSALAMSLNAPGGETHLMQTNPPADQDQEIPEETEEPEEIEPENPLPFLSEMFPPAEGHLKLLADQDSRAQSFTGPGKDYASSGGYKPWKQQKVTVYFSENGWILADVVYASAEERFVWFADWNYDSTGNVPSVTGLTGYDGAVLADTDPYWGPGSQYNTVPTFEADAGTPLRVFFQENGYVYAEYDSPMGLARMWFPADRVEIPGMSVTYTDEPFQGTGESYYGMPRGTD